MVSMVSAGSASTTGQVDILIGIIILVFYVALTGLVYWVIRYRIKRITVPWKHHQDLDYESLITESKLFKELKPANKTNLMVLYTLIVDLMHDFFLPIFLVFLVKTPYIQLILVTLTTGLTGWFYISTRPYKNRFVGILKTGNKCIYFTILLAFLLGNILERRISKLQSFTYFGFGVIGLISILMVFNVIVMLTSTLAGLLSKKKSKKDENPEEETPSIKQVADLNAERRRRARNGQRNSSSNQSSLSLLEREGQNHQQPLFQVPANPRRIRFSQHPPVDLTNHPRSPNNRGQQSILDNSIDESRNIDIRRMKKSIHVRAKNRPSFYNKMQKSLHNKKKKKSRFVVGEGEKGSDLGLTPRKLGRKTKKKKLRNRGEEGEMKSRGESSSKNQKSEIWSHVNHVDEVWI